jgi:uncharacterized phage protein (TIGR02218 family)
MSFHVLLDDGSNRTPVQVNSVSGANWILSGPVGRSYKAAITRLESLFLARFESTSIRLKFTSPAVAECSIDFRETPWDLSGADGETVGTTIGALPAYAYLYVFSIPYPGGTQTWRYTSFERNLSDGTNTYTATTIENDDITETATIERQSVTISARTIQPLSLMIPFTLEWPLMVDIYEADVSGNSATHLRELFSGEISECNSEGPFLSVTAKSLSSVFDRQTPRRLYQAGCNWNLFEPGCGLSSDAWKFTGTITGYDPVSMTFTVASVSPAIPADHFFAGGYLYFGSVYRMITDSVGATVTIASPLLSTPSVGSQIYFYPGCNGDYSTCKNKFNNASRFGGFPFIPVGNPSMINVKQDTGGSGKK